MTEDNIRETNNSDKEVRSWNRIRKEYGRSSVIELDAFRFIGCNELHCRYLKIWLQQSRVSSGGLPEPAEMWWSTGKPQALLFKT